MKVAGMEIQITGRFPKMVRLKEEWDDEIINLISFINELKNNNVKADILSFCQQLPESRPRFSFFMEWDSVAAIPIVDYEYWLKKQVAQNSRKKIGVATRKGVEVRECFFDDELVKGILDIYHDSPLLQGKPNRQYRTDFEMAKKLNGTFLDRARFFGAYNNGEMIAYIKLVAAKRYIRTMGILVKSAYREKGAMNLLIAKAVEICAERKVPYLVYSRFNYGKRGSETLKAFKKNLGFESIVVPRFFIPLNSKGKMALILRLHREFGDLLPETIVKKLILLRTRWYKQKYALRGEE